MTPEMFVDAICANPAIPAIVERLPAMGVDDVWLTGGCLAQSWWNIAAGRDPQTSIRDYDIFYFDPDTSWEAEDAAIKRAAEVFKGRPELGNGTIELRNQARVHLWFANRFGVPCPPLQSARAGIDRFLFLGIRLGIDAAGILYAPAGLNDTLDGVLRPDPALPRPEQEILEAADYHSRWPKLRLVR